MAVFIQCIFHEAKTKKNQRMEIENFKSRTKLTHKIDIGSCKHSTHTHTYRNNAGHAFLVFGSFGVRFQGVHDGFDGVWVLAGVFFFFALFRRLGVLIKMVWKNRNRTRKQNRIDLIRVKGRWSRRCRRKAMKKINTHLHSWGSRAQLDKNLNPTRQIEK